MSTLLNMLNRGSSNSGLTEEQVNDLIATALQDIETVVNYFTEETTTEQITNINNFYSEVNEATGFTDADAVSLSFVDGTRTFTISPAEGYDLFVFYAYGNRYEKEDAEFIQIDDVNGLWYIYYNSSGVLGASQDIWNLSTQVPVASILWDNGSGEVVDPTPPGNSAKPSKLLNIYVMATSFPSSPEAGQTVLYHAVAGSESVELAKNLPYSFIKCKTVPTENALFLIYVNGVQKGSATILAGQTNGSFTWNSKVTLVGGNIIEIVAPAVADATLACIAITIQGTRV